MYSNEHLNREPRWDLHKDVPSGWAREKGEPGRIKELGHRFYDRLRRSDDTARKHERVPWGKRVEWTEQEDPAMERSLGGGEHGDQRIMEKP
jgi:hydrogenase small subunit